MRVIIILIAALVMFSTNSYALDDGHDVDTASGPFKKKNEAYAAAKKQCFKSDADTKAKRVYLDCKDKEVDSKYKGKVKKTIYKCQYKKQLAYKALDKKYYTKWEMSGSWHTQEVCGKDETSPADKCNEIISNTNSDEKDSSKRKCSSKISNVTVTCSCDDEQKSGKGKLTKAKK